MARPPRVLVLMATYNGQTHLAEQLDSILCQTGVEVTLRVSDDCSTDNTFRILETYAAEHSNIEIIYNSENKGVTHNFMELVYGAPADEYDFFALADQDDIWHPDKLCAAASHISANTSRPELYYAGVNSVDSQGNVIGNELLPYTVCADHTGSLLLVNNWGLACTMLLNGALIKLLRQHIVYDFGRTHDAWIHAVALYCGGFVYCDLHHSYVDKRQGGHNSVDIEDEEQIEDDPEFSRKITQMAQTLLREYRQDMETDTATLVEAVAYRQESAKARRFLYHRKDIMMTTKPRTTQLRWMILFNRY